MTNDDVGNDWKQIMSDIVGIQNVLSKYRKFCASMYKQRKHSKGKRTKRKTGLELSTNRF